MGYVGNQQTEGYSQVPAKQDLTGATGTSLTLTHAVASAEGIDLYINNVRQEPTEAYSVVGTAVTLTGSVVATDDIYVVYNSLALQTTTPPDASVSTAKIIDGDVTSAKLDTNIAIDGDFTVDTSTLKVDSTNNRVGIGTSSPSELLEVNSTGASTAIEISAGLASTTTGEAKLVLRSLHSSSGTDYSRSEIASLGVAGGDSDLIFRTTTDSSGPAERMRIDSGGSCSAAAASGFNVLTLSSQGSVSNTRFVRFNINGSTTSGTEVGSIQYNGTGTSYITSSDYRLKENVIADWDATTRLKQLNPVRFNFISNTDTTVDGFLAHEVQSVVPEAISGTHNEVDDEGNPVYQGIDQSKLVPLLVKTIQELEARIAALEAN